MGRNEHHGRPIADELAEILARHKRWLDESEGWSEDDRADLRGADLGDANLRGANLVGADLGDANLRGANLWDADLRGAMNIPALVAAQTEIVPREGSFISWKKLADGRIAKLRIPAGAQRSNATGRKCRASFADVLEIRDADGNRCDTGVSKYDRSFTYRAGCRVGVPDFDPDRFNECAPGIHFYLTREEAEAD